ncbi:MAG TPA: hypothetical protein VF773_10915 [Verrucomicrobiae bacterium]
MRIFADNVQLADHGQIESFSLNEGRVLQLDDGPNWEEIKVRDRKNSSTEIVFTVWRLHLSLTACERFILQHAVLVPRRPAVFLMVCDYTGQKFELRLLKAGIESVGSTYIGATSTHTYRVVGGRIV